MRANAVGLATNLGLAGAKLSVGVVAGSQALIADGFNSAGDVLATSISIVGYRFAQAPADDNHHYGHGNADSVAGLAVGIILLITGLYICLDGARALAAGRPEAPGILAAWVALVNAGVKEALYRYTRAVGERLNSPSILASARDHRADVVSAITVLGGVMGARAGMPWLDPICAVGVGVYIAWLAWEPVRANLGVLMDEAPPEVAAAIYEAARGADEVRAVGAARVHPMGSYYMVDIEIFVDGDLPLRVAHDIAHAVEERVKARVEHVREVHVHVNPTG